jgi:hypothetical protein
VDELLGCSLYKPPQFYFIDLEGYFPKPTTSFDKWQLDLLLLLLLLLHHGPILGEHFHEADVKADGLLGETSTESL